MNHKKNIHLLIATLGALLYILPGHCLKALPTRPEEENLIFPASPSNSSPSNTSSWGSSPLSTSPLRRSPSGSFSASPSGFDAPLSTSPKLTTRSYNPAGHFTEAQNTQRNQANDQHKRNLGAAMILIVKNPEDPKDPYLSLIQRGKLPYGIALAGGGIEKTETALEAAIRETQEELRYTISDPSKVREIYNTTDPKQHPSRLAAQFMYYYHTPEDYPTMCQILRAGDDARAFYLVKMSDVEDVLNCKNKKLWEILGEEPDWIGLTNTQFALKHELALEKLIQIYRKRLMFREKLSEIQFPQELSFNDNPASFFQQLKKRIEDLAAELNDDGSLLQFAP